MQKSLADNSKIVALNWLDSGVRNFYNFSAVLFVIILAISIISSWLLSKNIIEPIKELKDKVNAIALNNLSIEKVKVRTKDELKNLANAFNNMLDNLKDIIFKITKVSLNIQNGSLVLSDALNENSAAAQEIGSTSQTMVKSIETQNTKVEDTIEELAVMLKSSEKISVSSAKILESANAAVSSVDNGNIRINEFTEQLKIIEESVDDTSNITEKIDISAKEMNKIYITSLLMILVYRT